MTNPSDTPTPETDALTRYGSTVFGSELIISAQFARTLETRARQAESALAAAQAELEKARNTIGLLQVGKYGVLNLSADITDLRAQLTASEATITALREERDGLKRLLFAVRHQRTGAMGIKIEDILFEQNEPLLLQCVKATKDL